MSLCGMYNCSKCCYEREVILTHGDISRLLTMGHYEQTFTRPSRYGHNLKELIFQEGKCVFLQNGKCSVYDNRPTACRIYPLLPDDNGCDVDVRCPHREEFQNDDGFLTYANEGLRRIIEDIERTIALSVSENDKHI